VILARIGWSKHIKMGLEMKEEAGLLRIMVQQLFFTANERKRVTSFHKFYQGQRKCSSNQFEPRKPELIQVKQQL
jgi:hypothetical protein